jgi:hypothetical protein
MARIRWPWHIGRGDATKEESGIEIVYDLAYGDQSRVIRVPHEATAFQISDIEVDNVEHLIIRQCATNGPTWFDLEIEVCDDVAIGNYGYAYGTSKADWAITWRRRGIEV